MPTGAAIVCDGGISAPGADYFYIKIQGKGCHGSMPNAGIDPVNVAAHIITALQELHARELSLSDKAVLTFGSVQRQKAAENSRFRGFCLCQPEGSLHHDSIGSRESGTWLSVPSASSQGNI